MTNLSSVMSVLTIGLGIAMIVITLVNGGGPVAFGIIIGVLFVFAGGGRLWAQRRL